MNTTLLVLDSLFDDLDFEAAVAAGKGWTVARWDGSETMLRDAAAVLHVRTPVDRALLDRMPACRVVARFGTGLDTVDQAAALQRGVKVVGVRDYCITELATHTLGLAFALDRRLGAAHSGRMKADATWQDVAAEMPIAGRTAATVIGFGSMGAAATRALVALGLTVRVVTRHGGHEARRVGAQPVTLDEALTGAGFVFLHAALTPETTNMIDRARLARCAPDAILVNTARLGLMDEGAVAEALGAERLAGVALDARLPADSPLRRFVGDPRFLVTPHIGWYSERSARELRERTVLAAIASARETERPAEVPGMATGGKR